MATLSQKFYEATYRVANKSAKPKNLINKLYLILRKFETYRDNVAYRFIPQGGNLIDIGCGNGNLVFKSLSKTKLSIGIDVGRPRLAIAINKAKSLSRNKRNRVKFLVLDVDNRLPYKNNFFDTVTMIAVLEHLFDPYSVLNECKRILKKNGSIIIQVPNLGFFPRRFDVLLGRLPVTSEDEAGWDGGHLHYFTVSTLKELLTSSGFTIKTVTCSGLFAYLRSWWVELLGGDIIVHAVKN